MRHTVYTIILLLCIVASLAFVKTGQINPCEYIMIILVAAYHTIFMSGDD